jgi:hypothetical protein
MNVQDKIERIFELERDGFVRNVGNDHFELTERGWAILVVYGKLNECNEELKFLN